MRGRWQFSRLAVVSVPAFALFLALVVYPAAFPDDLKQPEFNLDPAEGKVWVNSEIVLEVRGSLSPAEVLRELRFDPPVHLSESDVSVEHVAKLPWHEGLPWATTIVRINADRAALFEADTTYRLVLEEDVASFETITLPAITSIRADLTPEGDLSRVPTTSGIVIAFNEEVTWDHSLLQIEPSAQVNTAVERSPEGGTAVRISPVVRWDNATTYTLRINGPVEDVHEHTGSVTFAQTFTTWQQPRIVALSPQGQSQPVESVISVAFDRDVNRASVMAAFRVDPPLAGFFEWHSERAFVWRPQALPHSAWYTVSVGGNDPGGDTIVPAVFTFRTQDPPVFVELVGRNQAPAVLEARASGGLGSYWYSWSTGEAVPRIMFPGAADQVRTVEITVGSGDRTTTQSIQMTGPPAGSYVPSQCPEGWDLIEVSVCYRAQELPGPVRSFVTRVDTKDPSVQVRATPAADTLGALRTTSEQAATAGAIVAANGDFFYHYAGRHYTLGPMVSGGSFAYAPASPEQLLALDRERHVWTGPSGELRVHVQSSDGNALALEGVNEVPEENSAGLFNGYWGNELDLPFDGCVAVFAPADGGMRATDYFTCGPVSHVPLFAGEFAVVGRGAAAEWMQWQAGNAWGIGHSFPLGNLDFVVGGSHVLIHDGVPSALPADVRNPRTAVGVDAGGFMYLVVVDGRSAESLGMTLAELQAYASQLGMTNALNLDGGGSSTLVLRGTVVNKPSDGQERPVAGMITVGAPRGGCPHPFARC